VTVRVAERSDPEMLLGGFQAQRRALSRLRRPSGPSASHSITERLSCTDLSAVSMPTSRWLQQAGFDEAPATVGLRTLSHTPRFACEEVAA
jgi:hypothetical protein